MKNSGNNLQYSGNLENIFKIAVYNILHKKNNDTLYHINKILGNICASYAFEN